MGHVSLEWKPEVNRQLDLPIDGVIWATTLYISFPLRGYGPGQVNDESGGDHGCTGARLCTGHGIGYAEGGLADE